MKKITKLGLMVVWLAGSLLPMEAAEKVRVLVVTGGHGFETNRFFEMFKANPDITFKSVRYPQAQEWFLEEHKADYDVLVFYDMWKKISPEAEAGLVARLEEGKGLVALHHCLASFPDWEEYTRIIGGKYHLKKKGDHPASTYKHGVQFRVEVADGEHPVTRGVKDFDIHDETYGGFEVRPEAHVLLTTQEPTSGPAIAWCKTYRKARVVYIELGHDHLAYENPNYRRLLRQAIAWTAGKGG